MLKMILAIGSLFISTLALAETVNQRTAKEMSAVLQSPEVQALLSQEDRGVNLKGIRYLFSYRAPFGPAMYELSFGSNSGPSRQVCTVPVQVNMQTTQVIKVDSAICK